MKRALAFLPMLAFAPLISSCAEDNQVPVIEAMDLTKTAVMDASGRFFISGDVRVRDPDGEVVDFKIVIPTLNVDRKLGVKPKTVGSKQTAELSIEFTNGSVGQHEYRLVAIDNEGAESPDDEKSKAILTLTQ